MSIIYTVYSNCPPDEYLTQADTQVSDVKFGMNVSFFVNPIRHNLQSAAGYYPSFGEWLGQSILDLTDGNRSFVLCWADLKLVGINILKHTPTENKLCTFWVHPDYRSRHIASNLLERSLPFFTAPALITIPDFLLGEFHPLIYSKGFSPVSSVMGLYQRGITEHFFKIPLPVQKSAISWPMPVTVPAKVLHSSVELGRKFH